MRRVCGRIVLGLALALSLPGTAFSGAFQNGEMAFRQGDYKAAMSIWRPLAESGDARAQYHVAVLYGIGAGVLRDAAAVVTWMRLSADQGFVLAQSRLGFMYEFGERVPQNQGEAVKWYTRAARQGDDFAQGRLALMRAVSDHAVKN